MRLVLWDASTFGVYDIERLNQIYWTPKQLRLKINKETELTLEIESHAWFRDGTKKRLLKMEEAFAIYFENDEMTVLFQKKMKPMIRVDVNKEYVLIGRDSFCDVVYHHPTISKKHCEIFFKKGWHLKNLSEVNGTYVNGSLVDEIELGVGDQIFIGGIELWFCECFLLLEKPEECRLPVFIPNKHFQMTKEDVMTFELIEDMPKPVLSLPEFPKQNLKHLPEVALMVALMWLESYQGSELWLYLMVLRVVLTLLQIPYWIAKCWYLKRKFKKENKAYQLYFTYRYPDVMTLEKQFMQLGYLLVQNKVSVRLGMSEHQEVVLHSFEEFTHLVIVGNDKNSRLVIHQIIYQLLIYHPEICIGLERMDEALWFCQTRLMRSHIMLWIGQTKNDEASFWIEPLFQYREASLGYDALLDLNQNVYHLHQKSVALNIDKNDTTFLFSHHYDFSSERMCSNIPATYFDLIGLKKEDILSLRKKHHIEKSLIGCIGYHQEKTLFLDLNEHQDGPHLLIAGMTGSGKSEWLLSYLLSITIYYDSLDVQFFFIDFKGGGLSQFFEHIAHTTMVLTDLEPYQIQRAIDALQDEIHQREWLLLNYSRTFGLPNMDIHDLNRLYRENQVEKPLAHLLVIVDEFAELKRAYPEMMSEIVRIARVGRSLGIHLILSTQRPSGVVDAQMLSNIGTKVSLKVASRQDSYDLLSKFDAASLKEPGEFYIQKQNQSHLEYGKAMLVSPQKNTVVLYDEQMTELHRFCQPKAKDDDLIDLVNKINAYSQVVSPLFYKDFVLCKTPCFGVIDNPKRRQMIPFDIDYPCLIVGASQKTLALILEKVDNPTIYDCNQTLSDKATFIIFECAKTYLQDSLNIERLCKEHDCIFVEASSMHLRGKFMELMKLVIYFDDESYGKMMMTRTHLKCEKERHIGILVNQKGSFRCQIQKSSVYL